MSGGEEKFWYNLTTGQAEDAARAPELLKERSRAWAEDEARDDAWGATGTGADDK